MDLLERVALLRRGRLAVSGQTLVPGFYAWAVTVAGPALGRGVPASALVPTFAALLLLLAGPFGERRWGARWRPAFTWGFVLCCAVAWGTAPATLAPLRSDALRSGAGLLGWALFAFASALPPVNRREPASAVDELAMPARRRLVRGDAIALAGAGAVAAGLQLVGWQSVGAERELLVRTVALGAGLAILGAAGEAVVQRHAPQARVPARVRLRRGIRPALALGALLVLGVLLERLG